VGDHRYAIDKLKETISSYDVVNPNLYIHLGINYLKLGGENGGEAVSAFQEAINRDPKNAYAYYRIGKIYQTQNNKEPLEENYRKALAIDPSFAPAYFSLFLYYSLYNTDTAKRNLDLFLEYADKDPVYDFYNADYLFRVGQYEASLAKAKALETKVSFADLPRLAVLLAYNYDRIGDSTQAKSYIEKYLNSSTADKILNEDYVLAVKILSKFSGNQAALASLLEKAIAADPVKENKLKYYKLGIDMFEKSNMYADESKWYANYSALRGVKDEVYYYKTASIAINAKDPTTAMAAAKEYIAAFPDKSLGYTLLVKGAKLLDTANQVGQVQFDALTIQNQFLVRDATKNKQALVSNYYGMMTYYNELKAYDQAVLMCDKVLELIPAEPQTVGIRESLLKNLEISKKNQQKAGTTPPAK
jgi:tetratricopeptide (TPR) repeat protein